MTDFQKLSRTCRNPGGHCTAAERGEINNTMLWKKAEGINAESSLRVQVEKDKGVNRKHK